MTAPNPLELPWLVIFNRAVPGELVTIQSGANKYAVVFTTSSLADSLLRDLGDPNLEVSSLETWVLKDAFLTAAGLIGATRVIFDYQSGQHDAVSAPREGLTSFVRERL
jgi:hypothetical protein